MPPTSRWMNRIVLPALAAFLAIPTAVRTVPAGAASPVPPCAGAAAEVRLHIHLSGIRNAKGEMAVTLYPDDPDRFLARKGKIARVRVPVTAPDMDVCLPLPQAAAYAVAVYHDENANHDFDRTFVGMPKEGYGFSNDADTALGIPRFRDVRFETQPGDNRIRITLRY